MKHNRKNLAFAAAVLYLLLHIHFLYNVLEINTACVYIYTVCYTSEREKKKHLR